MRGDRMTNRKQGVCESESPCVSYSQENTEFSVARENKNAVCA